MKRKKAKANFYLILVIALISLVTIFRMQKQNSATTKSVAVIVPMEHQALNDIYLGFKSKLEQDLKGDVTVKLFNAQGDINLEQAMLRQAVQQNYDLIVPVTTKTAQMAATVAKNQKIIFLAANISPNSSLAKKAKNLTGIIDQIPSSKILEFIKVSFPTAKKVALVHSSSDKIYHEVEEYKTLSGQYGLETRNYMVQTLAELYPVAKSLASETDLIFILKDNLIASGVDVLVREAKQRGIPLLTSDEGTVKKGAHLSLGVKESDIGKAGAMIAAKVLQGHPVQNFPIQYLSESVVFMNKNFDQSQKIQKRLLASGFKVDSLPEEKS
jgi:putative tryptophan/tyrosine transport system substrate-binding protein